MTETAGRACRPRNPVWLGYFADPFVLQHDGTTTPTAPRAQARGRCRHCDRRTSRWEPLGDVLEPLSGGDAFDYWAPEVAHRDGTWWMYYSAGGPDGEGHRLRVARGEAPAGPFSDTGVLLDPEDPFSIDAHPFRDANGAWYLFYARDFLTGDRVGTGIVVDRLPAPDRLGGDPRVVVRPHEDWQLYEAARTMYGQASTGTPWKARSSSGAAPPTTAFTAAVAGAPRATASTTRRHRTRSGRGTSLRRPGWPRRPPSSPRARAE